MASVKAVIVEAKLGSGGSRTTANKIYVGSSVVIDQGEFIEDRDDSCGRESIVIGFNRDGHPHIALQDVEDTYKIYYHCDMAYVKAIVTEAKQL